MPWPAAAGSRHVRTAARGSRAGMIFRFVRSVLRPPPSPPHGGADRNIHAATAPPFYPMSPPHGGADRNWGRMAGLWRRGVAPSRGRGSKRTWWPRSTLGTASPPHGGADRNILNKPGTPQLYGRPLTGARIETRGARPAPCGPSGRPLTGARIETSGRVGAVSPLSRRPLTGARIETCASRTSTRRCWSPPHGGADRNSMVPAGGGVQPGRPLTGARIETAWRPIPTTGSSERSPPHGGADRNNRFAQPGESIGVAPSRGRGSKPGGHGSEQRRGRRPLTGARIETHHEALFARGAQVAPSRGRGSKQHDIDGLHRQLRRRPLTGARIETPWRRGRSTKSGVAPSRGRGSKPFFFKQWGDVVASPPHGGADRNCARCGCSSR